MRRKRKKQPLILPDADRINCDKSWDGKSGRGSCCNFSRRCRCSFLDVGDCTDRFVHCFYRGNTGTDIQRKGSFIWRLQRRVRHIISTPMWRKNRRKKRKKVAVSVLFAISGLICWCGISQVISNSVVSSFKNAFSIPPIYTTVILVAVAAVIVLRKNATVKVLDMIVPVMAVCYFAITILIIVMNFGRLPGVFGRNLSRRHLDFARRQQEVLVRY